MQKKLSDVNNSATLKVTLISTANNSIIPINQDVRFEWSSSSSNTAVPITHKIRIVEVKTDQTTEVALRTNKPIFEKDSLNYFILYPTTAPRFVAGSKYYWEIIASQKNSTTIGGTSTSSLLTGR